jgi:hypothetical protein
MIIKSTAGAAFAVVCLSAIATLSGAHAQMGGPPLGSYWAPPAPYGYAPGHYGAPPAPYGYAPGHYGAPPSPYAPQGRYAPPSAGTQLITNGPQVNRVMFHHPGRHNAMWRRANNTTGC